MELAWVPNTPKTSTAEQPPSDNLPSDGGDVKMEDAGADVEEEEAPQDAVQAQGDNDPSSNGNGAEADYDVAADEDQWMGS